MLHVLKPACYACKHLFTLEDDICVKVAVSKQQPLRFHDGYCLDHFTYGLVTFIEHRRELEAGAVVIQ